MIIDYVLDPAPRRQPGGQAKEFGIEDDCPWFAGLHLYVPLIAGCALTAAQLLIEQKADVALAWDGGRHHAQKGEASGFCYVADIPLVLLRLKRAQGPRRPRVMYLDLDLHFADGVSIPFAKQQQPSRILTLSIHHASPGFFPAHPLAELTPADTADPFTLSIPLARGASNKTFHSIWGSIERVKEAFRPDFVVVQCGVDGLSGDPLAIWNWGLNAEDEGSLGWYVRGILAWGARTLFLGGGGYHSPNAARAWTYLTSVALGSPFAPDLPVPEHSLWPYYAPSFTMEVETGNMSDHNDGAYLSQVDDTFKQLATRLQDVCS